MKAILIKEINDSITLKLINDEIYHINFNIDKVTVIDDYLLKVNNNYINTNYVISVNIIEHSTIHKVEMSKNNIDLKIL